VPKLVDQQTPSTMLILCEHRTHGRLPWCPGWRYRCFSDTGTAGCDAGSGFPRGPTIKKKTPVLTELAVELPDGMVITDPDILGSYRQERAFDPSAGTPLAVVRPTTTEQVQTARRAQQAEWPTGSARCRPRRPPSPPPDLGRNPRTGGSDEAGRARSDYG
jgi:hypothetical protein